MAPVPVEPTDRPGQLFEHFQRSGETELLGPVFKDLAPGLLGLALHVTRRPEQAEDLVQTVFLKALQQQDWDGSTSLGAWFSELLIQEMEAQNFMASQSLSLSEEYDLELIPTSCDPLSEAEDAEVRDLLRQCMSRLPERYREVVRLRIEQGMTSPQVGLALGRSAATIRSQLARGLDRLRRGLSIGPELHFDCGSASSIEPAGPPHCFLWDSRQASPSSIPTLCRSA